MEQLARVENASSSFLNKICSAAAQRGNDFDLSDCIYGAPHWEAEFISEPFSYYYFLAGFVNLTGSNRILEIGTHFGGSIKAMIKGVPPVQLGLNLPTLVTVDVTNFNEAGFEQYPYSKITRIHGDASSPNVVNNVTQLFCNEAIDILYVDAIHTYEGTSEHINLYTTALKPRFLILDDIHLNPSMQRLWSELCSLLGNKALDVSTQSTRGRNAGFGVCDLRS